MRHTRRLTPLLLALAFAALAAHDCAAQAPPSKRIANYKIDARLKLDDRQRPTVVEGDEQLTWLNDSPDTITELQFHLYLNAFKNEKSTFFRESGGQLRGDWFEPGEWGWIDVTEMKVAGGEDLTGKVEFIHPDDDNADDRTVIRVPLSKPVAPGARITLDIKFTARLPRVFARTGYWNSFAMVAQWFPKIGVWEQVGERRATKAGWNCHQFHANSEFYADFGVYDVSLTVPAAYKDRVGATGRLRSTREHQDGTVTYNFYQEDVHDFAWTADTNYVVVKRTFKPGEWVKPQEAIDLARRLKLTPEQVGLGDVEMTLLIQPENRAQVDRHFAAVFNAIKYFGLWYGPYPYETLTVIDPPYNAGGAGGMEYPTLITAGTRWWAGRDQNPEEVIVHEFAHQYWYGLVATNEFEEPWLDEGFTTYSTAKALRAAYGANVLPVVFGGVTWGYLPLEIPHPLGDRLLTFRGKFDDPVLTSAWKFSGFLSYALNSYRRTGLTLATLERYLGEEVMARVMREYFQQWKFAHPTSEDFFETAERVSGQDLRWFFGQLVRGTQTLDYEIAEVSSRQPGTLAGVYDQSGQKTEISEEEQDELTNRQPYETEVTVRRVGEAYFPVDLVFTFDDASRITARGVGVRDGAVVYRMESSKDGRQWDDSWPHAERWKRFKFSTPVKLRRAEVDPEQKVLLDANLTNNSRVEASGLGAALRWSSGALFWLQNLLHTASFIS
jgi:hypothetical protein